MKEIDFRHDLLPLKNQLFRLALRIMLDTAEAEDIVEDTLIRVWTKRHEWGEIESLEALCHRICRNLALDRKEKKESQKLSLDENPIETADPSLPPDELLEYNEKLRQVNELFNALPEKIRTVLQLRDIEGKSYQEIAEIMGLTEGNVKVMLHRARQTLRNEYKKIDNYGL